MRPAVAVLALVIAGAACAPAGSPPNLPVEQGSGLTVSVVDSLNDAGRFPSLAVDANGNPSVTYLLLKPTPKPGLLPAPIVAGAPQPPAVMLATLRNGTWNRTSVTPQKTSPAEGDAPEIANKNFEAIPGVDTSLAIDAQGKHHVAWSTPSGVYYSDDSAGTFSPPDHVTKTAALGVSVGVDAAGTPWLSFYEGNSVVAATRSAGAWKTETVATAPGANAGNALMTALRVSKNGQPIVAFGVSARTEVATRTAKGQWRTQVVGGSGGYAVSMALDRNGAPHVAYYDASGRVYLARSNGPGTFETAAVATTTQPAGRTGPDAEWSTGVAVDDRGNEYLTWADPGRRQIYLATNSGGALKTKPVPSSGQGINPTLAVASDGRVLAIGWYDSVNEDLDVATTQARPLALAFSPLPPSATPAIGPTTSGPQCQPSGSTTLDIAAPNGASASGFDKKCLAVAAGKPFTVTFKNDDVTIHNWDLYKSQAAATSPAGHLGGAKGPTDLVAAGSSATYKNAPLPAGTYYFQCDVHPTVMFGTFVVAGK